MAQRTHGDAAMTEPVLIRRVEFRCGHPQVREPKIGIVAKTVRSVGPRGTDAPRDFPGRENFPPRVAIGRGAEVTRATIGHALKLIEHGHSGDDWDISDLKLIFNFVSQKGTQQVRTLDIPSFKLHDTKNSQQDSKQIFFQPYSPEKFVIQGQ